MSKMKVAVLLSTYNGEKYLAELVGSILSQSFKNFSLYARDDGSEDNTVSILKHFAKNDTRVQIITDELGNIGASASFLTLARQPKEDVIFFADQDDIWLPNKIESMMAFFNSKEKNDHFLLYSNSFILHQTKITKNHVYPVKGIGHGMAALCLQNGGLQGASFACTSDILNKCKEFRGYVYYHDQLISLVAAAFGTIEYIDKSLMYYRLHEDNLVGRKKSFLRSLLTVFRSKKLILPMPLKTIQGFLNQYKEVLRGPERLLLEDFLNFVENPIFSLLSKLIFFHKLTYSGSRKLGALRLLFYKMSIG